jgi:hypothetical protein
MATAQRGRIFVRSDDGAPTVVSSRGDNFAARLCRRHRIADLRAAATVGLLPAFVDLDHLERETSRVLRTPAFDREAERRVRAQGPTRDERNRTARVASHAAQLRADDLAVAIEPHLPTRPRSELATRAVQIATRAPFDVVKLDLADQDLDLHTDLVLARDVTLASFGDIRIYRGAALVFASSTFILRAASARGDLVQVSQDETHGISLADHAIHV